MSSNHVAEVFLFTRLNPRTSNKLRGMPYKAQRGIRTLVCLTGYVHNLEPLTLSEIEIRFSLRVLYYPL